MINILLLLTCYIIQEVVDHIPQILNNSAIVSKVTPKVELKLMPESQEIPEVKARSDINPLENNVYVTCLQVVGVIACIVLIRYILFYTDLVNKSLELTQDQINYYTDVLKYLMSSEAVTRAIMSAP